MTGSTQRGLLRVFIHGSCVSRDTFSFMDERWSLQRYLARQSLLSVGNDASSAVTGERPFSSRFQEQMRHLDMSGGALDEMRGQERPPHVLLLDLVDERFGVFVAADGTVLTDSVERRRRPPLPLSRIEFTDPDHLDLWRQSATLYLDEVRRLWPSTLVACFALPWAEADEDGEPLPGRLGLGPQEANRRYQPYHEHLASLGVELLGVDLRPRGSSSHQWGLSPFHYTDDTYLALAAALDEATTSHFGLPGCLEPVPAPARWCEPLPGVEKGTLDVVEVPGATVGPYLLERVDDRHRRVAGAVHDADGLLVPESVRVGGLGGDLASPGNPLLLRGAEEAPLLDGPWLYGGPWMNQFGHFVVESLTGLWPERLDGERAVFSPFLFGAQSHPWQMELVRRAGWEDAVTVTGEACRFEQLRVPSRSLVLNQRVTPEAVAVWRRVADEPRPERDVFLSRSRLERDPRSLGNDAELDSVFAGLGFDVVHPQELSMAEQLAVVARARTLAGVAGSALHLSAFAPASCLVIELGDPRTPHRPLAMQRLIDEAVGHPSAFVAHDGSDDRDLDALVETVGGLLADRSWHLVETPRRIASGASTPVVAEDQELRELAVGTRWRLRVGTRVRSDELLLATDGTVHGYENRNEARWGLDGGTLRFTTPGGTTTSELVPVGGSAAHPVLAGRSQVNPDVVVSLEKVVSLEEVEELSVPEPSSEPAEVVELFRDENVVVRAVNLDSDNKAVLVTFANWRENPILDEPGFGQELCRRRGWSGVFVVPASNDWYMNESMPAALVAARSAVAKFDRVVTYGSSMGGYGALNFAEDVGAAQVVSVMPQFSIDGARVPDEARWRQEAARIDFGADRIWRGIEGVPAIVLYDPFFEPDRMHAELIAEHAGALLGPLEYIGHSGPAASVLSRTVTAALDGLGAADLVDLAALEHEAMAGNFPAYFSGRAGLLSTDDFAGRLEILREGVRRFPGELKLRVHLVQTLMLSGNRQVALAEVEEALALFPRSSTLLSFHADSLARLGRYHEARRSARLALDNAPTNHYVAQQVDRFSVLAGENGTSTARGHLNDGRLAEAKALLLDVVADEPHSAGAWSLLASATARLGELAFAAAASRMACTLDPSHDYYPQQHRSHLKLLAGDDAEPAPFITARTEQRPPAPQVRSVEGHPAPVVIDRHVRLKEFGLNVDRMVEISDTYLDGCDGSLQAGEVLLRTDERGFIRTGNGLAVEGRRSIMLLGDSFVEALFSQEADRWPAVLERELESARPGRYRVLNGGYSGATSLHLTTLVHNKITPLLPSVDHLLLFVPTMDMKVLRDPSSYWAHDPFIDPVRPCAEHYVFPREGADQQHDVRVMWATLLRFLIDHGAPVTVVAQPFRRGSFDQSPYLQRKFADTAEQQADLDETNIMLDAALRGAQELGVRTLDARNLGWGDGSNERWFYDELHLNDEGQQLFGTSFARAFLDLDESSPRCAR